MKHFKYRQKDGQELWVCEVCKKNNSALILLRTWELIDRKEDYSGCEYCVASTTALEPVAVLDMQP